jgi:hypothetical protein
MDIYNVSYYDKNILDIYNKINRLYQIFNFSREIIEKEKKYNKLANICYDQKYYPQNNKYNGLNDLNYIQEMIFYIYIPMILYIKSLKN